MAVAATAVVAILALGRYTARADAPVYDLLSKLAVRPPAEDIVIVAIDNPSIEALGRWPWPRALHTELLRRLADIHPKAIAYDVLFVDPDRDPQVDAALADAVRAAAPAYLPLTFDVPGDNGAPYRTLAPVPPLRQAAAGLGQVNIAFDPDGVVRRAYLSEGDQAQDWPHLMELIRRAGLGGPSAAYAKPQPAAPERVKAGLERRRPVMIAFSGSPGRFRTISFADVVRGETPPAFLRDKLVLVGATADGLGDRYATPLSGGAEVMSGVELQANLLDTLLTNHDIRPLSRGWTLAFSLAPLWLMLAGFLRLRPRANMYLGGALVAAILTLTTSLFLIGRVWAPPAAALIGLLLVYPLWSWRRLEATSAYMVEELDKFSHEPDLLPALQADPPGEVIDRQVDLMRRAVGRARDLRRFVSDALQGLPDATLVIGLDNRVLLANREAEALFETTAGRHPTGQDLGVLLAAFTSADEADLTAGGDVEAAAPDGRVFDIRRTPFADADGGDAGWIVRLTDISAIKAAGRQREGILQLLTHDMRSPQVSILALLDGHAGEPTTGGGLGERIRRYAQRTLALADNFVHLARAETPHYTLEVVNLSDLVMDAADDLWPQSSAKGIAIHVHGGEAEHLVMADRTLLTRALINLLDNAMKFTDPGGRVDCRLSKTGSGRVRCEIADTGRGMSADQLAHLFERFRRAPAGERGRADGVGLGLTFVQTVIRRHGGEIVCDSKVGVGTTFTVTLPLTADAS